MPKKLDYSAAWADATGLLSAHREAVVAIAGFFLFAVSWAFAFLVPEPDVEGLQTFPEILAVIQAHFVANWMTILPVTLIGSYGGFVLYVLLSAQNLPRVGDALTIALSRFVPYFIASLILGWLTILGLIALLVPGLYLVARFVTLPAAMAENTQLGIIGGIKETWNATAGVGWRTFLLIFIVAFVTWLISKVANIMIGLVCVLLAGPEGLPLVQTGVAALLSTAQGVILIALVTAIYSQLKAQMASR
jgi:hypothetical protein